MSFLSKLLARRKERRPPKRSAAHIPRGIATHFDDDGDDNVWNGRPLGPDVIPAIPRSPIDYAFNKDRQVWQPQPRPVSPILPIQADAAVAAAAAQQRRELQERERDRQRRIRHQASTGDLERIVYFMSSSTSLPPLPPRDGLALHHQSSRDTLPPLRSRAALDAGTLLTETHGGSLPSSPPGRSLSPDSAASGDKPTHSRRQYAGIPDCLPDQEEYFEPPRRQVARQRSLQHVAAQPLSDQVEYLSDSSGSREDTENDQHEPQGLGQFASSRSKSEKSKQNQKHQQQHQQQQQQQQQYQPLQSPSMSVSTATTGPFFVDTNDDEDNEDDAFNNEDELEKLHGLRSGSVQSTLHTVHDRHVPSRHHHQSFSDYDDSALYEYGTPSELSSYSAAVAAFPVAAATIGIATTVDDKGVSHAATTIPTRHLPPNQTDIQGLTALSPPPRMLSNQRLANTAMPQRASSNIVGFAAMELSHNHGGLYSPTTTTDSVVSARNTTKGNDRGHTSWVSSVSSYYGREHLQDAR